jgi:hypothetical protein
MRNYRLQFVNYTIKDTVIEYFIRLTCDEDRSIKIEFYERYSALNKLHFTLMQDAKNGSYPKFPPKKH